MCTRVTALVTTEQRFAVRSLREVGLRLELLSAPEPESTCWTLMGEPLFITLVHTSIVALGCSSY